MLDKVDAHNVIAASEPVSFAVRDLTDFANRLAQKGARIFSLDCFDTLLWRSVATPQDVFLELQTSPTFKALGMSGILRSHAEHKLRSLRLVNSMPTELSLKDIYAHALPEASDDVIAQLVAEELVVEKRLCAVFEPVQKLLLQAKALGMMTIVVSDTYLTEAQLRDLIAHCAEKAGLDCPIDHVFASSDWTRSKKGGLFKDVCRKLKVQPDEIIHFGDNKEADFDGARKLGVRGYHFQQYDADLTRIAKDFSALSKLMLPHVGHEHPINLRWKSIWAERPPQTPAESVGTYTLGPALYNFSHWIANQVEQVKARGEMPKLVFLMRDGHAASIACRRLAQTDPRLKDVLISNLELSRFVAFAASFRSRKAISEYLTLYMGNPAYETILNQLLHTEAEALSIAKKFSRDLEGIKKFFEYVLSGPSVRKIIERSADYRARFYKHLQNVASPQPGETLLWVDIGYAGTIHTILSPILARDLGVKTLGLFMMMSATPGRPHEKYALLDGAKSDARAIESMFRSVKLFEQICANQNPSVRDFDASGAPIYASEVIPEEQRATRFQVQEAAFAFLDRSFTQPPPQFSPEAIVDETIVLVARYLFMPKTDELALFDSAVHDVNLGTSQFEALVDTKFFDFAVRQRGIMSLRQNERSGIFWELRSRGIEDALQALALVRFEVKPYAEDFYCGELPVILMSQGESLRSTAPLYQNRDGYLRAILPLSPHVKALGVLLGEQYSWVQIHSVSIDARKKAFAVIGKRPACDLTKELLYEGIQSFEGGLLKIDDPSGFVFVHGGMAPEKWSERNNICEFVFRPLVMREESTT